MLDSENSAIGNSENNVNIFKIGLLNIRSIKKKDQVILQYITLMFLYHQKLCLEMMIVSYASYPCIAVTIDCK